MSYDFNWYKCSICKARVYYVFDDVIDKTKCFGNKLCKTCCNIKKNIKQTKIGEY